MANLGKAYEGVQVTKQGGVQSFPASSIQCPDQNEVSKLLEQQVRFAEQAHLEKEKALREADVQNQLQLEAAELARVGRQRYQNTAEGLSVAENEVALAIEKERHFEEQRARAHEESIRKEEERAKFQAAYVLLAEEIAEAEKLEKLHEKNKSVALNHAKAQDIAIREAQLKMESIRLRSQLPTVEGEITTPTPVKIHVEVPARELPEQRVFSSLGTTKPATLGAKITEIVPEQPKLEAEEPKVIQKRKIKTKVASESHGHGPVSQEQALPSKGGEVSEPTPSKKEAPVSETAKSVETQEAGAKPKKKTGLKKFTSLLSRDQQ